MSIPMRPITFVELFKRRGGHDRPSVLFLPGEDVDYSDLRNFRMKANITDEERNALTTLFNDENDSSTDKFWVNVIDGEIGYHPTTDKKMWITKRKIYMYRRGFRLDIYPPDLDANPPRPNVECFVYWCDPTLYPRIRREDLDYGSEAIAWFGNESCFRLKIICKIGYFVQKARAESRALKKIQEQNRRKLMMLEKRAQKKSRKRDELVVSVS